TCALPISEEKRGGEKLNKLVQITLKADQEKYNLDGDASITVVDANSYYIGRIITQHHGWITFESIDQGGNLGGIVFIKEDQVAKIERSEEHTSELQSRFDLVCRLLLEK